MADIPVLLVDDDEELCDLLTRFLSGQGFATTAVHNGSDAARTALSGLYRLVILDRMLPGKDGMTVLREIREDSQIPILMLTARGDDSDRIRGLELGADDYLPKPFNPDELVARMRAILRRFPNATSKSVLRVGDLEISYGTRTVSRSGGNVELTGAEFDVLVTLVESAGKPVSRDDIAKRALGRTVAFLDRSVDMHISNLRKKLRSPQDKSERIRSIRGTGYVYTGGAER